MEKRMVNRMGRVCPLSSDKDGDPEESTSPHPVYPMGYCPMSRYPDATYKKTTHSHSGWVGL